MPKRVDAVDRAPFGTWAKLGEELVEAGEPELDARVCRMMCGALLCPALCPAKALVRIYFERVVLDTGSFCRMRCRVESRLVPARFAEELAALALRLSHGIAASHSRLLTPWTRRFDTQIEVRHVPSGSTLPLGITSILRRPPTTPRSSCPSRCSSRGEP